MHEITKAATAAYADRELVFSLIDRQEMLGARGPLGSGCSLQNVGR
jgi:hypothetical protein